MKNMLIFFLVGMLFLSCHSRYWYREKVRISSSSVVSKEEIQETDTTVEVSEKNNYVSSSFSELSLSETDSLINNKTTSNSITGSSYPKASHSNLTIQTPDPKPKKGTPTSLIVGFVIIIVAAALLAVMGMSGSSPEESGCLLVLLAGIAFVGFLILFIGLLFS